MQTHFSEEASMTEISTKAHKSRSMVQDCKPEDEASPYKSLLDKVEDLLKVE